MRYFYYLIISFYCNERVRVRIRYTILVIDYVFFLKKMKKTCLSDGCKCCLLGIYWNRNDVCFHHKQPKTVRNLVILNCFLCFVGQGLWMKISKLCWYDWDSNKRSGPLCGITYGIWLVPTSREVDDWLNYVYLLIVISLFYEDKIVINEVCI